MNRFVATLFVVLSVTLPVWAQESTPTPATPAPPVQPAPEKKPRPRITLGPEVGVYIPTSDRTRAAFGETWVNYGVGFRPIELAARRGLFGFDLNIISTRGTGRRALLIPASLIYKRAIGGGEPGEGITPYVGGSAGLLFADLRSDNFGISSGFRGGFGGSGLIGITYQRKAYLEARYQLFSKIKGYDLSGLNIAAGFRF